LSWDKQWIDEIHEHCPGVKVCLVALKCDLREDPMARERVRKYGDEMVEYEQVRQTLSSASHK